MRMLGRSKYSLAATLLVVVPTAAKASEWTDCQARDRTALLRSALVWEVDATARDSRSPVACVVVGVAGFEMDKAVDPPEGVLIEVAKVTERRVVPVSRASGCPGAPRTFVSEPRCADTRAIVATRTADHCPLVFKKVGNHWVDVTPNVCA